MKTLEIGRITITYELDETGTSVVVDWQPENMDMVQILGLLATAADTAARMNERGMS